MSKIFGCQCEDCVKKMDVERIPTQEELLGEESKRLLKAGINLVKLKPALKDAINAILVDNALSGDNRFIAIHWSIYDPLQNWLRAEFPKVKIGSWPWGNWWTIRVSSFNKETQKSESETRNLVVR